MQPLWNFMLRHKTWWIVSTLVLVALIVALMFLLRQDDTSPFFYDAY